MGNNSNIEKKYDTRRLVLTGLVFALAIVLTVAEDAFPSLPLPVPGVKLGLSNIAVMYALFFLSRGQAYSIVALKAVYVIAVRGLTAGILSLSGGMLSLTFMIFMMLVFGEKLSYITVSISGAVAHNMGQFIAVSLLYAGINMWIYMPVLLVSGTAAGIVTASLLRLIIPVFKRLNL
jgi:heptaprenyl diphosphate synthase